MCVYCDVCYYKIYVYCVSLIVSITGSITIVGLSLQCNTLSVCSPGGKNCFHKLHQLQIDDDSDYVIYVSVCTYHHVVIGANYNKPSVNVTNKTIHAHKAFRSRSSWEISCL